MSNKRQLCKQSSCPRGRGFGFTGQALTAINGHTVDQKCHDATLDLNRGYIRLLMISPEKRHWKLCRTLCQCMSEGMKEEWDKCLSHRTFRFSPSSEQQKQRMILRDQERIGLNVWPRPAPSGLSHGQMQMQQTVDSGSSSSDTKGACPQTTPSAHEWCPALSHNVVLGLQ